MDKLPKGKISFCFPCGPDILHVFKSLCTRVVFQALKMPFFSSRPYPTKGPLLPLPKSAKKMENEQATRGMKRKREDETDGKS